VTLKARLDKLRFLAADMRLAYRMSTFAPNDADARMLVRHVIIRAESFIEHARAIRRPLNTAGFDVREFHKTKENYAALFMEYFRVARDRLGAHVQDLDFGRRIELWNDIDRSKSEFFADGAVEIYRLLESLAVSGIVPFADFPEFDDPRFQDALVAYRSSGSTIKKVEMATDSLGMTRPDSITAINLTPVHGRAAQIALIHRWMKAQADLMRRFEQHPNAMRMLRARAFTDVVSCCDCLITRPVPAGSLQAMDGLDRLIPSPDIGSNSINAFAASFKLEVALQPIRHLRDKFGAHFEIDPAVALGDLLNLVDGADLKNLFSFYGTIRNVFEKACRQVRYLSTYLADGETLYGVLGTSRDSSVPFSSGDNEGRVVPAHDVMADTEEGYAQKLAKWLDGPAEEQGRVRSHFWSAFQHSEVVEDFTTVERFGSGERRSFHKWRRLHQFILDRLLTEKQPARVVGIIELLNQCANGDPDVLTELLLRFAQQPRSADYACPIAIALGNLAKWSNDAAKIFLRSAMSAADPYVTVEARIAQLKVFVRTEGLTRINPPHRAYYPFSDLDILTRGCADDAKLIILTILASQFCDQRVATFSKPFLEDYAAMRAKIPPLLGAIAPLNQSSEVEDMARRLVETQDFVGVCLFAFDTLKDTPQDEVGRHLATWACTGQVVAAHHDQSRKHLCGCYLRLQLNEDALRIADNLAALNPENVDFQILRLQTLAEIEARASQARRYSGDITRRYSLTAEQAQAVAEVDAALLEESTA
jgi:hypothetical protein